MEFQQLQDLIQAWGFELEWSQTSQFPQVYVPNADLHAFCRRLKEDPATRMDYLFCLTGVDYADHLEVVYHLESSFLGHQLVVKVKTRDREDPRVRTVYDIWPTAEYHEREVYDLLGIRFDNHPDLRRLLLTDDWEGYPLRKDYSDPKNLVEL